MTNVQEIEEYSKMLKKENEQKEDMLEEQVHEETEVNEDIEEPG